MEITFDDGPIRKMIEDAVRNVLQEKLEENFNNVHKNIDNLRNVTTERINDLQGKVEELQIKIAVVENELKNTNKIIEQRNNEDIQKLQNELDDALKDLDTADKEINSKNAELTQTKTEFANVKQNLESQISQLNGELSNAHNEINFKNTELIQAKTEFTNVKQNLENQIAQLNDELANARNEFNSKNYELEQTKKDFANVEQDLKSQISQLNGKVETLEENLSSTGEKLKAWTNSADVYAPVRDAITKCPTFSSIVETYGLDDMSDEGLLKYAQTIGTTENFAYEIYQTASETKKQNKEFMTPEEVAVYDALNRVYRQNWNIEHDIFALPGEQPITGGFQKTNFDSSNSIYLAEPRNKSLPYATGIYVPILKDKEGGVKQKAYVDAGNR